LSQCADLGKVLLHPSFRELPQWAFIGNISAEQTYPYLVPNSEDAQAETIDISDDFHGMSLLGVGMRLFHRCGTDGLICINM
jgi:hypothetical protein